MSVLVVGLSYRTAPLDLLERAALGGHAARTLELDLCRSDSVAEAVVLATCNRLEVYAEVSKFHGGVADVGAALAAATGVSLAELTDHLYVHYEAAAVTHLFTVAAGLDSMAVGEQQILGQVRSALRGAQDSGAVSRVLGHLLQVALRVGKRAHAETGLDQAAGSLVEAGIAGGEQVVGPLSGAGVLVVGAGAMSGLAVATLARHGVGRMVVANRTQARAQRLAEAGGGTAVPMSALDGALAAADVVVSCTGAVGHVVSADRAARAMRARDGRPQVYVDLALPRDVDPAAAAVDGVTVLDLEALGRHLTSGGATSEVAAAVEQVRALVAEEVSGYLAEQRAQAVAPTVVALRAHARSVVEAELARLQSRLAVDDAVRAEIEQTVHRVVEKLLHNPTVRVKELAGSPSGSAYAEALRELFGLDLGRVAAVTDAGVPGVPGPSAGSGLSIPAASASGVMLP